MTTAKVFESKYRQAIRLPKHIRVAGKKLEIFRHGDEIILREKKGTMLGAFELLASLPNDLTIADRRNDWPQKRSRTRARKRGRG